MTVTVHETQREIFEASSVLVPGSAVPSMEYGEQASARQHLKMRDGSISLFRVS
jgi:hypothetical protein